MKYKCGKDTRVPFLFANLLEFPCFNMILFCKKTDCLFGKKKHDCLFFLKQNMTVYSSFESLNAPWYFLVGEDLMVFPYLIDIGLILQEGKVWVRKQLTSQ